MVQVKICSLFSVIIVGQVGDRPVDFSSSSNEFLIQNWELLTMEMAIGLDEIIDFILFPFFFFSYDFKNILFPFYTAHSLNFVCFYLFVSLDLSSIK